jgi:O-acetylserine/cysteine efflux transporter
MNLRTLLLALAAPICWGTGLTLAKPAANHFPALFMMLLVYGTIAIITTLTVRERIKTRWPEMVLISATSITIQGAFLFWGLRQLDATTTNLVLQTQVPIAILLGAVLANEKLEFRKSIGMVIALIGVAIVIGLPEQRPPVLPTLMILACAFFWALGQVLARKLSKDSGLVLLKANALYSVPQLLLATLLLDQGQFQSVLTASPIEWAALIFVILVGFYAAYLAWFTLLKQVRVDVAAPFVLLMTPIGVLTAHLVLGEAVTWPQLLGGAVLLFGLAITSGLLFAPRQTV